MAKQRLRFPKYPFIIDIKTQDARHFTSTAYMVDRPQFIKLISQIRTFLEKKFAIDPNVLGNPSHRRDIELTLASNSNYAKILEKLLNYIRWDLSIPLSHLWVIRAALLFGEVTDNDYKATLKLLDTDNLGLQKQDLLAGLPQVTELATDADVLAAFHKVKADFLERKQSFTHQRAVKPTHSEILPDVISPRFPDTKGTLKETRSWYFQRCHGSSLTEVAIKACRESNPPITLSINKHGKPCIKAQTEASTMRRKVDVKTRDYYTSLVETPN